MNENPLKNTKRTAYLIGGGGFIGGHLVKIFKESQIFSIKVLSRNPPQFSETNITSLQVDASNIVNLRHALLDAGKNDVIVNLSATINKSKYLEGTESAHRSTKILLLILEILKEKKEDSPFLLHFGSANQYGRTEKDHHKGIMNEESPRHPSDPYGIEKESQERYMYLATHQSGLGSEDIIRGAVIIPSSVYGESAYPGKTPSGRGVLNRFIDRATENKRLELFFKGEEVRDYIYVGDVAKLCLKICKEEQEGVFNAGTGKGTSIAELSEMVKTEFPEIVVEVKSPVRKNYVAENPYLVLDSTRAQKILNWHPEVELKDGISLLASKKRL